MPKIKVNGSELYYEDTGGPGEAIIFSHGLLWNTTLFAPQVTALKGRYRCISYDHRGQGQSADAQGSEIGMDLLTEDAVALIRALNLEKVHFCGLSMGGFIGMRLAARFPQLVRSLILCETSADAEPAENIPKYKRLNFVARWIGIRVVTPQVMPILFGKTALTDSGRANDRARWMQQMNKNRRSIWRAVNGVLFRSAVMGELPRIQAPTLVIVGEEDVATVPAKAARIAQAIPNAQLVHIPGAGHSSTVEAPEAVNAAIANFLAQPR
ncbi:MAG: alpha/beta fold hydrolase [Syntrophobacteraceae bacterium]